MHAPISADNTTDCVTTWGSVKPLEMVLATAVPITAPTKLKMPAMMTAVRMGSTPVDTTVAMALAASWKPLMKSKTSPCTDPAPGLSFRRAGEEEVGVGGRESKIQALEPVGRRYWTGKMEEKARGNRARQAASVCGCEPSNQWNRLRPKRSPF